MPSRALYSLDRRITAYHEAAHAVVALKFGIRVTDIALCHSGPLAGYVRMLHGPPAAKLAHRISRSSDLTWQLVARAIEDRATVLLAGPVAETRLLGTMLWAHGNQSDFSKCQQLCYVLDRYRRHLAHKYGLIIPKENPADMANRLRRRALRILANPDTWRAVTALAEELGGWGKLNGHDAADTVQWTRRIRNQLALRLPISGDTPNRHAGAGSQVRGYFGSARARASAIRSRAVWQRSSGQSPLRAWSRVWPST